MGNTIQDNIDKELQDLSRKSAGAKPKGKTEYENQKRFLDRFIEITGCNPNSVDSKASVNKTSAITGISERQTNNYFRNGSMPGGDVLIKIADAYGCSIDYLLGRTDYTHVENKEISELTGLNDNAIESLRYYKNLKGKSIPGLITSDGSYAGNDIINTLNELIYFSYKRSKFFKDTLNIDISPDDFFLYAYQYLHPIITSDDRQIALQQQLEINNIRDVLEQIYNDSFKIRKGDTNHGSDN